MNRLVYDYDELDALFPSEEEGQNVQASETACKVARLALGVGDDVELQWHLPDVFAVRYGSSYVGTATANGCSVQFHSEEGNFFPADAL